MFERGRFIRLIHEVSLKAEVSWSGSPSWNGGWSNAIIDCSELQPVILPDSTPRQQRQNASTEDDSRGTMIVCLSARSSWPFHADKIQTKQGDREEDSSNDDSLLGDFQPLF
jgi:hypothetical protein